MRMKYISQIMSGLKKYKTIYTRKATSRVLDGSYKSIYKGRSMNFEDLREYEQGDDVKDIDWKASARSRQILVREYIAEKKHNIMLVPNTNKRMLAETKSGQEKREVALMCAGTFAYLVNRNGDYVSTTYMAKDKVKHMPFETGLWNIEMMLTDYHKDVAMDNESEINNALIYITRHFRRRMIILVVADLIGINSMSEDVLKRIRAVHDVLVVHVSDADISGNNVYDIENGGYLPAFITNDRKLKKMKNAEREAAYKEATDKLKRNGVVFTTIDGVEDISTGIIELLEKHKLEKR